MDLTLTGLNRHPVKSCRGEARTEAVVEPWGLAGDRRWMLVDDDDTLITARTHPRLVLIRPSVTGSGLRVEAADLPPLTVPVPTGGRRIEVRHFRVPMSVAPAGSEAAAWFSKAAGTSARLVYLAEPDQRPVDPDYARAGDRVSFADGYPLLLASQASLNALNDLIVTGPNADEGPLPMRRFRPNLVVTGAPAWAEDGWRRIRVGAATFRGAKSSARCVLTLVDPDTALKGREPLATLARHRRFDGKTWFGLNLIPDSPGATIRVGDEVEVLAAEDGSEPHR